MRVLLSICLILFAESIHANCDPVISPPRSERIANYEIEVDLDHINKCLEATQKLVWINRSPDTVFAMHFYMYQNAFKNTESTFMKSAEGDVFGDDPSKRGEMEWGWIEVISAKRDGVELIGKAKYIQPDDENKDDQSVLQIPLEKALLPGDTLILDMLWSEKIPKIFARSGYEREDFFNMVHWFPQAGVWEEKENGKWGWNCHQFHRRTEFFAEFGNYRVTINLADHLVVGASGCLVEEEKLNNGRKKLIYEAQDVIDFAWCAYPNFEVVEDQFEHVFIRLLIPPEHCHLSSRIIKTVKHCLEYLERNVGPYPYNSITIMDPPLLGLKAGFMEYPTYITGGSFAIFPKGIRTMESLIAHEFVHQYFMAIVATNEKEEPWLDEGFTTYHEDKIMESLYGEESSLFNIMGYKVSNAAFSRHEYVALPNPSCGAIARPGWEIREGFKGITYSKTATMLRTLERMLGEDLFIEMIKSYYDRFKFKHPKGKDFIDHAVNFIRNSSRPDAIGDPEMFFDQLVYGTELVDYSVADISYFSTYQSKGIFGSRDKKVYEEGSRIDTIFSKALLHRKGGVILPVEVEFRFEDGEVIREIWSGEENSKTFIFQRDARLRTVEIDPENKVYLDINLNDNSLTYEAKKTPALKISSKIMYWANNLIQSFGILI